MPIEPEYAKRLDSVIRALTTACKSLRLYPPTSPIPRQSTDAASAALADYFRDGEPVLALTVGRGTFNIGNDPVAPGVLGVSDVIEDLQSHGVAEVSIMPGATPDDLLAFLALVGTNPDEVRSQGGISAALVSAGVDSIRLTDVQLTVVEHFGPAPEEDLDQFLRDLTTDPERLAAWFAAAANGDPKTFEEGLMELVRVAGPSGYESLLSSLSGAFVEQRPEAKDALLGLAMDPGPTRDLTGSMFGMLSSGDIAGSVLGGSFGKNMLSLSSALTKLPLEQVTAQVRAEVQAMLPSTGHTSKEAQFLEHMLEVRERQEPEQPLVDSDATYRAVLDASRLSEEAIATARNAVGSSRSKVSAASVRTILTLLDQQKDFELYCGSIDNLASMVPVLIEQGDLALARQILGELSRRQTLEIGPWPDLAERLREAITAAAGPRTMAALIKAVVEDRARIAEAREIVRFAGDSGAGALVSEAISHKKEGLDVAEQLVGRRLVDQLNLHAAHAQWFQLAPVAARLAHSGDPRSMATLEQLMRRPDEQSRREVTVGVAEAGGPSAPQLLAAALRDPSAEVAIVAARAMARSGAPGAASMIAKRLAELDVDNNDFVLGRELIAALARIPQRESDDALSKLASRRALIKRGHFAEIQDLVAQAQKYRSQAGGVR